MSLLPLPELSAVDTEAVVRHLEEVTTRLREDNPSLDLKPGVLFSLLAHYHAVLAARQEKLLEDYLAARSLLVIQERPELAQPALVDDILSNFRITRQAGRKARGLVEVVMSSPDPVVIPAGSVFVADGRRFIVEQVYTASLTAQNSGTPSDLVLYQRGSNTWYFLLPVVAESEGPQFTLRRGTTLVPERPPRRFVSAKAAADFEEGRWTESNEEILERLRQGISATTMSNRLTMQALLAQRPEFSGLPTNSIIGYGDPEMRRDRHSILPVALGGRVDWYIRTRQEAEYRSAVLQATLISKDTDGFGVWQIVMDRQQAAGCYEIVSVIPEDGNAYEGTLPILEETRQYDVDGLAFAPDVARVEEAVYSAFQTIAIRFRDPTWNADTVALGTKRPYRVVLVGLPHLTVLQEWVSGRDFRFCAADCLVKAPVPCFVVVHATIHRHPDAPPADMVGIADAVAHEINTTGFTGSLYASRIYDVMMELLPDRSRVAFLDLHGRLRYPDGTVRFLRSNELLEVPNDAERMVSYRTVQFFCRREDVRLTEAAVIRED